MDVVLSYNNTLPLYYLTQLRKTSGSNNTRRQLSRVAACAKPSGWYHQNTPLKPTTYSGEYLSGVLQNNKGLFHASVEEELKRLSDDRNAAISRMVLSSGTSEACLHRRIVELKEQESRLAIQDVIYMLILYKFSEIKVHLVPKLSKCIYNKRLEILPSKDWELESIHSYEVLEMIRDHLSGLIGLSAKSSVTEYWATTQVQRLQLGCIYAASILYGYFLKSACLRHHLELNLALAKQDLTLGHKTLLPLLDFWPGGLEKLVRDGFSKSGSISLDQGSSYRQVKHHEALKCYVMGFDPETLKRCAKPKSKEATELIEKHRKALFGDEMNGSIETDEIILTSFASLKRLVLEAVAFGAFLWDAEGYVDTLFKLQES